MNTEAYREVTTKFINYNLRAIVNRSSIKIVFFFLMSEFWVLADDIASSYW